MDASLTAAAPDSGCLDLLGNVSARRVFEDFSISLNYYPGGTELEKHRHERAHLGYTLKGLFTQTYLHSSCSCPAGSLRFVPAGEWHANSFETDTECLLVSLEQRLLDRIPGGAPLLEKPVEIHGLAASWLAHRMFAEFREQDQASSVALEGIILEILAEGVRSHRQRPREPIPRWLRRVREVLAARYLEATSLGELAAIAGVHQVHLSREFRRHFDCTIGEFLRKARIDHASRLLAEEDFSLAEIALTCGFSDQSHFSSVFKRQTGMTPAKYRNVMQKTDQPRERILA